MKPTFSAICVISFLVSISCYCQKTNNAQRNWTTPFEKSGGLETPRYAETMDFFKQLDQGSPIAIMKRFGVSPEGRDLNLFVISADKHFKAEHALSGDKPIILINCCIHPGESEGKDAAMLLVRDLLIHKKYPELPEKLIILIVPIMNPDGHERFGAYNRINQNGPKEMGWRVTSTRLNLNRDFIKADAPEMRAFLRMFHQWQPHFFYDCHTTDGVDYQYVAAYNIDIHEQFGGAVSRWAKDDFLPAFFSECDKRNLLIGPYARFVDVHHPEKGMIVGVWPPMLSNPYATVCNRAGFLIETHSRKPYDVRVKATYDILVIGLQEIAKNPQRLIQAVADEDYRSAQLGSGYDPEAKFPLRFQVRMDAGDSMTYHGYRHEMKPGQISGADYIAYTHEIADIPTVCYSNVEPTLSVTPPLGYLIPRQWTNVIDVLKAHGIQLYEIITDLSAEFEGYRFSDVKFRETSYEGRQRVTYLTQKTTEQRLLKAGSIYVPLGNPDSKLIMHILEPDAPDALVSWGFFNTIFEDREYFEHDVLEPIAQQMANESDSLKDEFIHQLNTDSNFARDPESRLQFFYERSSYWDHEKNLYPVVRITKPLPDRILKHVD